jgi:hypothetical protein
VVVLVGIGVEVGVGVCVGPKPGAARQASEDTINTQAIAKTVFFFVYMNTSLTLLLGKILPSWSN